MDTYESDVQKKLIRLKSLEDIRSDTITVCKEITDFELPRRGKYLSLGETSDQKKTGKYSKIIKNTACAAHRILKAGMHTGLTNQARPWFRLSLADRDLMDYDPVKFWLDEVRDILLDILAGSNFYETAYSFYGDQAGFGTATMLIEEDPREVIRCRLFNMGEYCIACNERGRVDTIYRRFYMTVGQVFSRWGDACSENVKRLAEKSASIDKKIQVVHCIEPREKYDSTKATATQMPWGSWYFEYEGHQNKFLSVSGYKEFPCMCARWEVTETNEWGDSPAMELLPDVKELQEIEKTSVSAMHMMLNPPILAPTALQNKFKRVPGSVMFKDISKDEVAGPLYEVKYDIASAEAKVQTIVREIKEGFFNDLFMMIASMEGTQPLTATEVLERREEKMTMLGPVVERNMSEFLKPAIERVYSIAVDHGRMPPPPPELRDMPVKIEFVSILAQALKMLGTQSIQSTINFALGVYQIKPDIVDVIDLDESVQRFGDFVGIPAKIIRSDDAIEKLRTARMEAQKELQQQQDAMALVEGAKTASETKTDGKNMLTDIAKGIARGQ